MEMYVSKVTLEVDGKEIDLVSVEEKELERRAVANTMHKNGTIAKTVRPGLTVKVLRNVESKKNVDLSMVKNATISIVFDDGSRTVYPNVVGLKRSGISYEDGKGAEITYDMTSDEPLE